MRRLCLALVAFVNMTAAASAQTADWRFHWRSGDVMQYRVEHTTNVSELANGSKVATAAKVNLLKRWEVVAVDAAGIATLKMSITEMRNEQTRPNGDVLLFDSKSPEKCTPELREQMSKYIGQTLAVLRIDGLGRVVEVKQGVANRYEAEPPFTLTLPPSPVKAGQSWDRDYTITLDPPLGTGEKHPAKQKHVCSKVEGGLATISLTTILPALPQSKADQLPLLQKMPQGEVVFDLLRGRLHSARLVIDRKVEDHQGPGSVYQMQSVYTERVVD